MKKKAFKNNICAVARYVKSCALCGMTVLTLSIHKAYAAAWDTLGDASQNGLETFAKVYTDRVWIIPTFIAAVAWLRAKDDRAKNIAGWAFLGTVAVFILCKMPIAVWQTTGEALGNLFGW